MPLSDVELNQLNQAICSMRTIYNDGAHVKRDAVIDLIETYSKSYINSIRGEKSRG